MGPMVLLKCTSSAFLFILLASFVLLTSAQVAAKQEQVSASADAAEQLEDEQLEDEHLSNVVQNADDNDVHDDDDDAAEHASLSNSLSNALESAETFLMADGGGARCP